MEGRPRTSTLSFSLPFVCSLILNGMVIFMCYNDYLKEVVKLPRSEHMDEKPCSYESRGICPFISGCTVAPCIGCLNRDFQYDHPCYGCTTNCYDFDIHTCPYD